MTLTITLTQLKEIQVLQKLIHSNDIDIRKRYFGKYAKVGILAYYIVSSSDDGTINKFIIIRILLNKSKAKMRVEHTSIRTANDGIYNIMGHDGIGNAFQYLVVFIEDVVTYA